MAELNGAMLLQDSIFTAFVFKLHISFISNQTSTVTKYLPSSEIYSFLSVLVII